MVLGSKFLRELVWKDGGQHSQVADFLCPFTSKVMDDPVTAEDGHTYERGEIEAWLEKNSFSPQTKREMGKKLKENTSLKQAINEYEKAHELGNSARIEWEFIEEKRSLVIPSAAAGSAEAAALEENLVGEPARKKARLEEEVGASSMAEALSKFFQELDPLRELLREVLEGWAPPRVVVIGDESAGKSTILEQLANMPIFPRKRRFCTRLPVHLRLRRDPDTSKAQLWVQLDGSEVNEGHGVSVSCLP